MKNTITPIDFDSKDTDDYGSINLYTFQCPECKDEFTLTNSSYPFAEHNYLCKCGKNWYVKVTVVAECQ